MDRMAVHELLEELIMTAQIDKLPSMHMAPAEMMDLAKMAKVWLDESDA